MARPSHVRDAIRSLLPSSPRHDWSADSLLQQLRARGVSADFSSVFRALQHLEREGLAQRVDLGSGKSRYEARRQHHEHIRCEKCGSVAEVSGCLVQGVVNRVEGATGYTVRTHELTFAGLCPACT